FTISLYRFSSRYVRGFDLQKEALMKAQFIVLLLTLLISPGAAQTPSPDAGPVTVVSFKWSKIQQTTVASTDKPLPARAVSPNDKNFERTSRVNDPAGFRDPNADTLD